MSPPEVADIIDRIIATAATRPSEADAERAIDPILKMLRGSLETITFDHPPVVFTAFCPQVRAGQSVGESHRVFRHRLNDLANAKRWTDAENVEAVIDSIVDDVRVAALGRFVS